jgi:hypothetical protein
MDRRTLLAATGSGLAALAGCGADSESETGVPTGEAPSGSGGSSTGRKRFGESATAGGASVTAWDVSVRSSIRYTVEADALDVYAPDDAHLAFVRITTDGSGRPERATFGLAVDGRKLAPLDGVAGSSLSAVQSRFPPYAVDGVDNPDGTWLLFEVSPDAVGNTAALVWQPDGASTAEWPLRERAHEALVAPVPRFELERFEAPDTVSPDEEPTATIVATNAGEVDGTFRATVNYRGVLSAADNLDLSSPAGESRTREYDIAAPSGGELRLELAWSGQNEQRTIDF